MNVSVEFTGQLKTAIARATDRIELPEGATVALLLVRLAHEWGDSVQRHLFTTSGQVQASLLVAINGTAFPSRQAESTVLQEGDTVVLLPPIAGG